MSVHPYWAYKAVPGTLSEDDEQAAIDEGRRAFALELATRTEDTDEGHLNRALKFEQYLDGRPVADINGAPMANWERNTGPADRGAL